MRIFTRCFTAFFLVFAMCVETIFAAPFAYVTNVLSNTITVFDVATNAVVDTISTTTPVASAVTPDATRVYVTTGNVGNVLVINTATNTIIDTINVGVPIAGIAITPDGTRAYVIGAATDNVIVIDTTNNTVIDTIALPTGSAPSFLAITPDGTRAYVTDTGLNQVTVINLATNTAGVSIPVGQQPLGIAITPNGTRAYVVNQGQGTNPGNVTVLNLTNNTALGNIPIDEEDPTFVAIAPDGGIAYVVNSEGSPSPVITRINTATNTRLAPIVIPIFIELFAIAITPDGAAAYVTGTQAEDAPGFAVRIDLATLALGPVVPVGILPFFISITPTPGPIVTSIDPTSGPTTGGTPVTITGINFTGATQVFFGTTPAASFVVNSDTSITAVSPAGTGTVDVTVVTPLGTSPTTPADLFTYVLALPAITSVNPNSGPESGGTTVIITGTGFTGATQVLFGSVAATSFIINSDTTITAVSPAGTGIVDIRVLTSLGASPVTPSDQFTYTPSPPPPVPLPPRRAQGHQKINRFATQTDYINILTWKAPKTGPTPAEYRIYRDADLQELLAVIPADRELKFKDHNRKKGKTYTYFIVSVDASGLFSQPAVVTVHPRH